MKHANKVAVVTGAAQGLGLAIAERFIADGAKVVLVDVQADKVKAEAKRLGTNASWIVADLSVISQDIANDIVNKTVDKFGSLDILMNNAGIIHQAEFVDFPEDIFDRIQQINVKSYFLIGQAVARYMIANGIKGAIVNMSSINALLAMPNSVGYAVSKGAVKQLTSVMAVSLIKHGIRVNAVGPGTIASDLVSTVLASDPNARRGILSRTPIGRVGEASEVASVVSFLASDDASYIVGQTIYPDGGRLVLNTVVPVTE
ncbi:dehydrogenase [Pseudomonas agarici]|uniref:Dehydrogenase n=1 Tax=Pseudomonas agarici TaxID=46677 RepID=A0A0X1T684_PSEAA|nr:glucose 1-dehydrogenase [Pseudomonas agarici]AMB87492.1 dehydrogenase [Pseudomonas agarici]NWC08110.1 glucose 1-dehydrogenase [Pseudomonas agarici]SEK86539.1 NAD(P)-dependent dehydrogenase, short-chain alcohol dehydrogenase family [Pseudomonas agarici]